MVIVLARLPEWSKGADLRSAVYVRVGSNPTQCTFTRLAQSVERKTFNLVVEGSSPSSSVTVL